MAQRAQSNTPLQALTLLNDPMMIELARAFGQELAGRVDEIGSEATLKLAFRRVLTRSPTDTESSDLRDFLERQLKRSDVESAWTALARALMCLDEAITRN